MELLIRQQIPFGGYSADAIMAFLYVSWALSAVESCGKQESSSFPWALISAGKKFDDSHASSNLHAYHLQRPKHLYKRGSFLWMLSDWPATFLTSRMSNLRGGKRWIRALPVLPWRLSIFSVSVWSPRTKLAVSPQLLIIRVRPRNPEWSQFH